MDTVQVDPSDPPFLPVPAMNWTPTQPLDDNLDSPDAPDRILQELSDELTGEPSPAGDAEEEDLTGLTEAELEGASGVESPPGRID
ncbi:hypothetical protein [Synechococcus sp. 1G10]|uniref:hypothetical protein n=1 Tax=Synechococcus sp. 1G10 TaxID=2025605 RepID=UPI000B997C0E|nr:hypothetical protein [Synechococcus sp. 1G10]